MPMLRRSNTANGAAASSWRKLLQEDFCVRVRVLTGPERATFTCSNYPHEFPDTLFVYGATGLVYADYSESALGAFGDKKIQELGTR
jgi:hypothetical protein